MSDQPLNKRGVTSRRRPGPQPAPATQQEIFQQAFMHALQGCCSQFETTPFVNRRPSFCEGEAELMRSRALVRRAWNIACYTTSAFETDSFNDEVF